MLGNDIFVTFSAFFWQLCHLVLQDSFTGTPKKMMKIEDAEMSWATTLRSKALWENSWAAELFLIHCSPYCFEHYCAFNRFWCLIGSTGFDSFLKRRFCPYHWIQHVLSIFSFLGLCKRKCKCVNFVIVEFSIVVIHLVLSGHSLVFISLLDLREGSQQISNVK